MEFSCMKEDLHKGVQAVERIVATRSTLPIIGNILFEAGKGGLKLSANNLEIGMEISIGAKVGKEGAMLIPAKTLGGIVSKLPEGNVNFKVSEKGVVKVSYKQSNLNIHGLPPDEFPSLPKVKEGKELTVDPKMFGEMVKSTSFAVSLSEDKYVLNGVLFEVGRSGVASDNSNIRLIATDGYRLARCGGRISPAPSSEISVIVPGRALSELSRIIEGAVDKELKIIVASDQMSFKYKDAYLVSRLIQGQFPDYKQVIPKGSEVKLTMEKEGLLDACERAAVIAAGSANIVKLETKAGKLHIIAITPDVGSADEVIDVEIKGKEAPSIAFNVRLISEALKVIDSDKVVIELSGPLSPGMIKPVEGADYIYIVMPIRTAETA